MKHDLIKDPDELALITRDKIHVGLEIGTSKICVCVSEEMSDGTFKILGVGEAPSRGVRKGEIIDPIAASECIRMAIRGAEASSGREIKKVSVAVTGSHLESFISRASLIFPKAPRQISLVDTITVEQMAWDVVVPKDNLVILAIQGDSVREFLNTNIDYQEHAVSAEYFGETCLKAAFHIIHGKRSRIQRTLDCLKSLQLKVENLVPNSVASSTSLFSPREKSRGVLVIDLGGGTTDYGVTSGDALQFSGVIAVGGDHIANDLSIGLRLPIAKAECIKIQEGSANQSIKFVGETITLKRDHGISDYEIDRMSLDTIIHLRVREIFEQIRHEILSNCENGPQINHFENVYEVVLTGGASKLRGIDVVAGEVFKRPVILGQARNVSGANRIIENPAFTTVIGITKFAIVATSNPSMPCGGIKRFLKMPEPEREFRSNEEYISALRKERESGKNLSRDGSDDLDVPTFLRKGTDGVEIKHAKKL